MSISKHIKEERDECEKTAREILQEIGEVEECPFHHLWFRHSKYETNEIYGLATKRLKEHYPDFTNFTLFHEQVKMILDESWYGCPDCAAELANK